MVRKVPDVKPEVMFLSDVLKRVRNGEIRVPKFQRPFVWNRSQMLDLLDSIKNQFPIGSLLAWETDEAHFSLDRIGPVRIPEAIRSNVRFLLDGHQRISTLLGVFHSDEQGLHTDLEDPGRWRIWYNAKDEEFEHVNEFRDIEPHYFPLNKLLNTLDFLQETHRVMLTGGDESSVWIERLQILNQTFNEFKVAVTVIVDADLNQAVEIFARLNRTGRRVTQNEMAAALLFSEGLLLDSELENIALDLKPLGYDTIDRDLVFKTCLADLGRDLYKTDWKVLYDANKQKVARDLTERLPSVRAGLIRAVKFLISIGVPSSRLLPYSIQLVFLGAFFSKYEIASVQQLKFLEKWFWVTSFTSAFATGNSARVKSMMQAMLALNVQPNLDKLDFLDFSEPALAFPKNFDLRSARVRSSLLTMVSLRPRNLDGSIISDLPLRLSVNGHAAFGYILDDRRLEKTNAVSPANRIVQLNMESRAQAKNWIQQLGEHDSHLEILASHGLPPDAPVLARNGEFNALIESRLRLLIRSEISFLVARGVQPWAGADTLYSPIDSDMD